MCKTKEKLAADKIKSRKNGTDTVQSRSRKEQAYKSKSKSIDTEERRKVEVLKGPRPRGVGQAWRRSNQAGQLVRLGTRKDDSCSREAA